jgi:N-acetylglucosamine-6-phosphate deacetylase
VKRAISFGIPMADAFYMASATPAALLGVNKGLLKVGYDADFILLDDDFNLIDTFILS